MAQALRVSVDTLLGSETAKRRSKATDNRLQRRLQQLERLDAGERRQVLQLLDAFNARGQLKRRVHGKAA